MELQTIEKSTQVSELNAFEIRIQEHEKELNFVPDMETKDGREKSAEVLRSARKTWKAIDDVRLELKKEAEKRANAIHEQGKAALLRLESKYNPHKIALDNYKAEQKAIEYAKIQAFNDLCDWLRNIAAESVNSSTSDIKAFIREVDVKNQDNTGLDLNDNQKFEYSKLRMAAYQKLEQSLQIRICKDVEEENMRQAAIQLEEQQAELRKQQEEFERMQQEERIKQAAIDAKRKAEEESREREIAAARALEESKQREKEAEERAKQAIIDAENNARIAAEKAIQEEKRMQQDRIAAEKKEQQKREANKRHVGEVRKTAKEAIMNIGADENLAKLIVLAINDGKIPAVTISY